MMIGKIAETLDIRQYGSLKEMKKIFLLLGPYILRHKKAYIGLFLLLFINIAITLSFAWFFGNITDAAINADFPRLKWLMLFGIGLSLISICTNFIDTYLEMIAVNAVKRDFNLDLYKHILLLPGKNLSHIHSGELLSHFTNDIHHIDAVIGRGLLNLVRFPLITVAAFIYLVQINWKLSLISVLVAPVAIIGGAVFGLLLRNNSRIIHNVISGITKSLNDTFHGFVVIRSFTLEKTFFRKYTRQNEQLFSLELKDAKLRGFFYAGGEAVGSITFLVSLLVGAIFVSDKVMTIGALLSFINLVNHLVYPLTGLAGQWAGYQRSISALERMTNLLDQPRESNELPSYSPSQNLREGIRYENVTFSYNEEVNVFEHFNLEIPTRKVVALVGPSGAGKSTLFNLLQGFYLPQSGSIRLDGQTLGNGEISQWRNSFAYVSQETFLFSGTIRENLKLARPGISDEEMMEATRQANLDDVIAALPDGYDTEIGERGVKLSGGQRQRLSIARAILKDAPILLLDEATSALDSETEFLVQEALHKVMTEKTTLVIAHRLSTIKHADLIVVLDKGKVLQLGNHDELIREEGLYKDLNKRQFFQESNSSINELVLNA
jgi:ATP-binding cassette, subfamily B, bacterial